jgi:micrococcal nuclease
VEVETVATDIYGRTIARIQVGEGQVDAELVRRGLAWTSVRSRKAGGLKVMQSEARRAQRGLWQATEPVPPWVWRREHSASVY